MSTYPQPRRLGPIAQLVTTRWTVPCSVPISARNARTIRTAAAL